MRKPSHTNPSDARRRDARGRRSSGQHAGHKRGDEPSGGRRRHEENSALVAVPWYVGQNFNNAPPGHRYLLYLPFWTPDWGAIKQRKQQVLKSLGVLPSHAQQLMQELVARQSALGKAIAAEVIPAVAISPFATGLGWEHPNENGFAFLHPYGLPYLAAGGVKGVVRRAAEELALFGDDGSASDLEDWCMLDIWWLFGFEGAAGGIWQGSGDWAEAYERHKSKLLKRPDLSKFLARVGIEDGDQPLEERLKSLGMRRRDISLGGALRFFDVIPEISSNEFNVDIMNPHYGDYYQGNSTPHDAGSPVPIFFLVIPPGSKFTFVVDCPRERYLPESLHGSWRRLLQSAFDYSFDWLGFGAKTAVGYGAMRLAERRQPELERERKEAQEAERLAMSPEEQAIADLRTIFEREKAMVRKEPQGELASRRMELLREAKSWESAELRKNAADLIEETINWIDWPKRKRDKRNKEIEGLRTR